MTKYGLISQYPALFWRTLVYARQVRGTAQVPPTYLIAAQPKKSGTPYGTTPNPPSDVYWLRAPVGGVSLQEFMGAFLTSPLFRLELAILKRTVTAPSLLGTLEPSHLERVASNREDSFGNWTDHSARGDPAKIVLPAAGDDDATRIIDAASSAAPTRIMRCRDNGGEPFCDTWWSVEPSHDEPGNVDLVFGTALFSPPHEEGKAVTRWMMAALDPFHRLYSRLLLASARANLEIVRARCE